MHEPGGGKWGIVAVANADRATKEEIRRQGSKGLGGGHKNKKKRRSEGGYTHIKSSGVL